MDQGGGIPGYDLLERDTYHFDFLTLMRWERGRAILIERVLFVLRACESWSKGWFGRSLFPLYSVFVCIMDGATVYVLEYQMRISISTILSLRKQQGNLKCSDFVPAHDF